MFPGYFALVMATGIVSIAAHFEELETVSRVLLWANVLFAVTLAALTLARLVLHRALFVADLTSQARAGDRAGLASFLSNSARLTRPRRKRSAPISSNS